MGNLFQITTKYWHKLTQGSVNRQIFGAALTVGVMTALVKVVSVAKELLVAWKFGIGDDLDAFFIALIIPSFLVNVVSGSFNAALIPTYIQVRQTEGMQSAQRLFSQVMIFSFALLLMATILMVTTAPVYLPWIAKGFSPEKLDLTFHLLLAISPWLILTGMIAIWGSVLNAGERFALAAVSPLITPVLTILFLFSRSESWGVYTLVFALVLGGFLELTVLGIGLKKQGIFLLPKWYGFDANFRHVIGQYLPMIAGSFIMSSNNLVDQSMAAVLLPGSVTALNYGSKLIALPLSFTVTALNNSVMPYIAKMTANKEWHIVKYTIKRYIKFILMFSIPLTICFIMISESLIRIVFQRGSVTAADTEVISQVQSCYALQIPFSIAGIIVVRAISCLSSNYILMLAAIGNLMINIILNYVLMSWIGVAGIALSTSCVMLYSFIYVSSNFFKKINLNIKKEKELLS